MKDIYFYYGLNIYRYHVSHQRNQSLKFWEFYFTVVVFWPKIIEIRHMLNTTFKKVTVNGFGFKLNSPNFLQ